MGVLVRRRGVLATIESSTRDSADRTGEIRDFIDRHSQRVVGALTLMCGDRSVAEDAVQEALVKAWLRSDEPIEQLSAWITVVATNHVRSSFRRKAAEERALTKVGGRAEAAPSNTHSPDDQLLSALRSLPAREREVAVLHYVLDESVATIAAALGVVEGTVKTLLFRARQHLADELRLEEGGER